MESQEVRPRTSNEVILFTGVQEEALRVLFRRFFISQLDGGFGHWVRPCNDIAVMIKSRHNN
jgi:hypothetical protein